MIEALDGMDLSGVPIPFLEAFPFPAFVLVVPIPWRHSTERPRFYSTDTDITVRPDDNISPLTSPDSPGLASPLAMAATGFSGNSSSSHSGGSSGGSSSSSGHSSSSPSLFGPASAFVSGITTSTVVWSNEKWLRMTEGRLLKDCLGSAGLDRLADWIEDKSPTVQQQLFTLEVLEPAVKLDLSKTSLPILPACSTHYFCIVTSQPRSQRPQSSYSITTFSPPLPEPSVSPKSSPVPVARRRSSRDSTLRTSFTPPEEDFVEHDEGEDTFPSGVVTPTPPHEGATTPVNDQRSGSSSSGATSRQVESKHRTKTRRQPQETGPNVRQMETSADKYWALVDNYDWASTAIGPRDGWKDVVDPLISVAFQSNAMECIWLGKGLQLIYNEEYSGLVDHPRSFGRPAAEVWAAIWDYIGPLTEKAINGRPVHCDNDLLLFKKHGPGILMEFYCSWRYVPIAGKNGETLGIYNQALETTDAVLAARRLNTARDLSEQLLLARTVKEYFSFLAEVLETNPKDVPFGLFYSVKSAEFPPKDPNATAVFAEAFLESTVGVPDGHPSAPATMSFDIPIKTRSAFGPNADRLSSPTMSAISALSSGSGRRIHIADEASWPILKALSTRQCVLVEDCRSLIEGYEIREWDELPMSALVVPICSETAIEVPGAFMILGLNLRRPFDADYDSWLHEIRTQVASTLVSVKGYEAEQQRIDDALKMERAKAAWFKGAAHDLRSPLTMVRGPIEDLLETNLSNSQKNTLQLAKRNVDRLLRLVNALMDFSRLEAGRVQGRFVPIDLGKFVADLAALFRPALERMKIDYFIEIQSYAQSVFVDPTLLETVLSNLISNALKYTEKGSVTVRLTFGDEAEISVIDTGIGIPRDEIEHIAEWFHRASSAIHAGTTGTGLGLALARELLRLHGGDLEVYSRSAEENANGDHGSTFIARIPLTGRDDVDGDAHLAVPFGKYGNDLAQEAMAWARDDRQRGGPSRSENGSSEGGTGSETQTGSQSGSGPYSKLGEGLFFDKEDSILIVDDSDDIREYLKRIFSPFCQVLEASNGEEALQKSLASPPNLILSDIMMPRMSGTELLSKLRANSKTYIPVVLLSAMVGDEARVDALLAGADDYLEKPFKPKELVARAHVQIQVGKKRNALEQLFIQREVENRFLSEYCPAGIVRTDASGRNTYINQAWRRIAGMSDEADPSDWERYCEPDVFQQLARDWTSFLMGREKDFRMTWRWKNGNYVSAVFVKLEFLAPGMSGTIGCMADITYEEQRVADAEQRRREAEESKHQQELLIDLTSHEIRTPVSAILQCSSLVKENLVALRDQLQWSGQNGFRPTKELLEDLAEDVEALESIYQCGLVQERIAGDILSYARIQLDMLSLHAINTDIKKEGRKILTVFSSEARMKEIQLALDFGKTFEASRVSEIKTDPVRLGQIVTNLISNAIRFTATSSIRKITVSYDLSFVPPASDSCAVPRSTGSPDITPPPEDTPLWLFVSVRDTGPGLPPNELALLFKRFSQGNAMVHTRFGGSGLGLFICKKITELLGGRIEVLSTVGEGSVFRFFIQTRAVAPIIAPIPELVTATSNLSIGSNASSASSVSLSQRSTSVSPSHSMSPAASVLSSSSPPPTHTRSLHILIVEDNIINQTVLKRQIIKAGLSCDVANNGLEALNLIREADRQAKRGGPRKKKPYNVILMDLEMPVMDGLTAVREIRALEAAGTLERNMVMALTGNARQGQIDQALAAGMDDVVIKPYVLNDLLRKIEAMWAKKAEASVQGAEVGSA
ncbi:hypothetical protein BD324DRAFT_628177 [Kockovaella imperatae]|uniref:Histidine kinase n=1 Tax=Kockovaella imperatae TaxID=4999 RepID=A0A1Y1UFI2_9TREE|nr:hypothetical protein BD324DRAFT_628177 [Kockovaella imperatae]ORX36287.1 hypothetical protein BD324DRAFT_628177 [Kockovaella imperatae]